MIVKILGYKISLEIIILFLVIFLVIMVHSLASCCNAEAISEGFAPQSGPISRPNPRDIIKAEQARIAAKAQAEAEKAANQAKEESRISTEKISKLRAEAERISREANEKARISREKIAKLQSEVAKVANKAKEDVRISAIPPMDERTRPAMSSQIRGRI
jgi:signal transduction histidine kinase